FYLLISFSQNSFLGQFLKEYFNLSLVFSFEGLVFASLIFSLPFMVNPLQSAFSSINQNLLDASYTLGKGKIYTLFRVILPNSKVGIFSACAMSFAHTIGEFGVVMMIGGHKKGETLVASIAIYDELEVLNYTLAHQYAFTLFAISFTILLSLYFVNKKIAL
ncbi:molybdenum ABC transporter permease, partial [Campylobacter jejuni]|nr:molybdenum ABC transporter permease [Campylobacter jejuni]EAK2499684.1 molybdenum ABC transporter permease [Campylobacter coli]